MNRRAFLGMLGGVALNEAIPFNRVWSFPKKIVIPSVTIRLYDYEDFEAVLKLRRQLSMVDFSRRYPLPPANKKIKLVDYA